MAISEQSATWAVRNVAQYGDTDVFPFPLENHWFFDAEQDVVALLMALDRDFETWLRLYPVKSVTALSGVGYNGFRAAAQIDPIWNAYLLSLLIEVGPEVEAARVPKERDIVFSYRFLESAESNALFDRQYGWARFQQVALQRAQEYPFVVSTDISDFYPRIYHHRVENALSRATKNGDVVKRIMEILKALSIGGVSYGLPVGGNAARMLAELLMNRTDRLLISSSVVSFCRFVDDYYLFAETADAAQSCLVQLSQTLHTNEGLTLTRSKTKIMSGAEFARTSPFARGVVQGTSFDETMAMEFLSIRLVYDPYSPTADAEYEELREQIRKFDITGMLARELKKSRIDESLTRQLVKAVRFLDPELRDATIRSIIANLSLLYPIFPTIAILFHRLLPEISDVVKSELFGTLRAMINSHSHILLVPANLSYAIRLLAYDNNEETDTVLIDVHQRPKMNTMIKRDVLLAMAMRRSDYWLSEQMKFYAEVSSWEKRSLSVASYVLGDEGRHWRERVKREFHDVDSQFMRWVGQKNNGRMWEIPL